MGGRVRSPPPAPVILLERQLDREVGESRSIPIARFSHLCRGGQTRVKRRKGHSSEDVKRLAAFWAKAKYGKIGVEGRDPVNA